jgi:bla regulator protein BlaR1
MNLIQGILPDRMIDALGWTILHSFWQGLLIGILLFMLLYFYRNHNSVIRYNLSVLSLGMIFGLSIVTFIFYFNDAGQTESITDHGILIPDNENGIVTSATYPVIHASGFIRSIQSITDAISGRFPFLITIWLMGVFIISARMTGGVYLMQRLRKSCLYEIPAELQKRFMNLIRIMNIHKRASIRGSSLITVPSVVGYFKPLILLPLCMITQMPVDQLEALLAHELAHIRRHDYLVNLFQYFMESLFFYHPVVWIIQKRIRKERENCCDDLALSYSQGKITYIKALTSIQEIPAMSGLPLLAIGSNRQYLLTRIIRILKREKMKTNFKDKLLAGFILVSALVIILVNTGGKFISFKSIPDDTTSRDQTVQISEPPMMAGMADPIPLINKTEPAIPEPVKEVSLIPDIPTSPEIDHDTSFKVKDNVIQRTLIRNGKEMDLKMKIEKGKVTELYVDGSKIQESDYNKYQSEIDKTLEDAKKLESDLSEANQELNQVDIEVIKKEMEENLREMEEKIKEIDVDAMVENIEVPEIPEIDKEKIRQEIEYSIQEIETIDMEKVREEMEHAMQSACEEMKKIEVPDMNELKMEMEKAIQELKEIDQEKIQAEIQEAMKEIQIDKEQIKREIEKSFQEIKEIDMEKVRGDLENEKIKMEDERIKMNEMLDELEKLELQDK